MMGDVTVLEVDASGRVVVELLTGKKLTLVNVSEAVSKHTRPGDIWTGGRAGLGAAIGIEQEGSTTAVLRSFTGYVRAPADSFPETIVSPFTSPPKVLVRGGRTDGAAMMTP